MKAIKNNKYMIGMLIMLVIALVLSTYAWFSLRRNVSLNPASMSTTAYGGMTMASGKIITGNFDQTATFLPMPNYRGRDISSNGTSFYRWTGAKDGEGKPTNLVTAIENEDYVAQDFTFLSNQSLDIYLASESSISNKIGALSPGARVGFYEWDGSTYNKMFVWAPETSLAADKITYVTDPSGTTAEYTAVKTGLPSVNATSVEPGAPGKVATLISDGTNRVRTIQIRLWLEGTDPASIKTNLDANNAAQWQAQFKFVGLFTDATTPLSDAAGVVTKNAGVTKPILGNGMIPVKYSNGQWVKSSEKFREWYDYNNLQWGNAVFVTQATRSAYQAAAVGTTINLGDVLGFLVWVPRYEYRINPGYGTALPGLGGTDPSTKNTPGAIEINFISVTQSQPTGGYYINKAFRSGNDALIGWGSGGWPQELAGFWVGKFETTGTASDPTILPNNVPLSGTVSAQYQRALSFTGDTHTSGTTITRGDTAKYGLTGQGHMMKNSEWGAVAYLSQSVYGRYGNAAFTGDNKEVYINPSSTNVTGRSGATVSPNQIADVSGNASANLYGYDGSTCTAKTGYVCTGSKSSTFGMAASTTGNIYGIYDMRGGNYEYVMGNYNTGTGSFPVSLSTAGLSGLSTSYYPPVQYIDYYNADNSTGGNFGNCYGHATFETSGWYGDSYTFVSAGSSWLYRGGFNSDTTAAGIFATGAGSGNSSLGFRLAVAQ